MTYEEILRDIAAKKFAPVYCLQGEEPYYIDKIEAAIDKHVMSEAEKGFNYTVLYGKDVQSVTLLDYLRRYPMMSPYQVVILREAQDMKDIGGLAGYLEKPMESTIFVICHKYKKIDLRTAFGKAIKAKSVFFESKKLYDNQVPEWVMQYAKSIKLHLDGQLATIIAEYLGTDLAKIANELDKIALNLPPNTQLTAQHIQEYIGISKDYNVFELNKAIALRDLEKVSRIRQYFSANIRKNPLVVTISTLFSYFSKLYVLHGMQGKSDGEMAKAMGLSNEWALKEYKMAVRNYNYEKTMQIISLLRDYDLKSKGVDNTAEEDELMQELFFKILH